jgi:hypothetical protein
VLQGALIRFDDGSRFATPSGSEITSRALELQQGIHALERDDAPGSPETIAALRRLANRLPGLADVVGSSVHRWAGSRLLFARARTLPSSEEHVEAVVRDRVVVVTPRDVGPVVISAHVVARLSTALAVDLERTFGRPAPTADRYLMAALKTDYQVDVLGRDERWAHRLAAACDAVQPPQPIHSR